jgi:hypothetical protein
LPSSYNFPGPIKQGYWFAGCRGGDFSFWVDPPPKVDGDLLGRSPAAVFSRRRARGKAAHAWRLGRRFRQSCPPIAFGLPFRRVASAFSLHPFVMVCNPQAKYQVTLPQRIRQNDQLTLGKDYIFFLRAGPLIRKKPAR